MTTTDLIIIIIVASIVGFIIWHQFKRKDEGVCTKCSYAKTCSKDDCLPKTKSDIV